MGLGDIGEFGFIRRISRGCLVRRDTVMKAIGDDAAAFEPRKNELILVTTDLLVERIHFLRHAYTGFDLGRKSLAVNLSDIAAMGGSAREAFVSLAIPDNCSLAYLDDFYSGMKTLAEAFDVNILGGDTTGSKEDLIINIALIGSVPPAEVLYRDGAAPGDRIFCTGNLGDSRAGLYLILNGIPPETEDFEHLMRSHLSPKAFLREGRFLARCSGVSAAIDVSDGFSSDLGHIAEASGAGVRIDAEKLPVSGSLKRFCDRYGFDPLEYAMTGGEDYVLLFTVSPGRSRNLSEAYHKRFQTPLFEIGEVTDTGVMEIVDASGRCRRVLPEGWDHFMKR